MCHQIQLQPLAGRPAPFPPPPSPSYPTPPCGYTPAHTAPPNLVQHFYQVVGACHHFELHALTRRPEGPLQNVPNRADQVVGCGVSQLPGGGEGVQ